MHTFFVPNFSFALNVLKYLKLDIKIFEIFKIFEN